jgi:hypothetical protein
MTETPDDTPPEREPWVAFELLLAWAEAIVRQRTRLEIVRSRLARPSRAKSTEELRIEAQEKRFANRSYDTECHLFIEAAWQLVKYSKWIRLDIVGHDTFRELNDFERDVAALKDGTIEHLTDGSHHPDSWIRAPQRVHGRPFGARPQPDRFTVAVRQLRLYRRVDRACCHLAEADHRQGSGATTAYFDPRRGERSGVTVSLIVFSQQLAYTCGRPQSASLFGLQALGRRGKW